MSVSMEPKAVFERLRAASAMADLRTAHRLDAKLDMSPAAVFRRLREVEALRRACAKLGSMRRV